MGTAGSDLAIEAADLALMADDLTRLPWIVAHGRRMLSVFRQNIALAQGVKAAVALLALGGLATLWGAIAADMGASLLVVANGLRLLRSADPGGVGAPRRGAPPDRRLARSAAPSLRWRPCARCCSSPS